MDRVPMTLDRNKFMREMYVANVPEEMKALPNWVAYKSASSKTKPGKYDKQLINPNHQMETIWAKSNDSSTWTTYDKAMEFAIRKKCTGVAFALQKELNICCVDLDHCMVDGKMNDSAKKVLKEFGKTYCEKSISGKGLHIFCKGKLPQDYVQRNEIIEMYDDKRFISMTGIKLKYSENKLSDVKNLSQINIKYLGEPQKIAPKVSLPTLDKGERFIIDRLKNQSKYNALFSGDTSMYGGDSSRADLALCAGIAFYTKDEGKIDSIFRQSGLYREKWDKGRYGEITIRKALDFQQKSYDPQRHFGNAYNNRATSPKQTKMSFNALT